MSWVVTLLVKGIQLVVDQSQLLRVRHLVLLLRVCLTRLFHALVARHFVLYFLDLRQVDTRSRHQRSKGFARDRKDSGAQTQASSSLSNRNCACALSRSAHATYWSTPSHRRGKSEIAFRNYFIEPLIHFPLCRLERFAREKIPCKRNDRDSIEEMFNASICQDQRLTEKIYVLIYSKYYIERLYLLPFVFLFFFFQISLRDFSVLDKLDELLQLTHIRLFSFKMILPSYEYERKFILRIETSSNLFWSRCNAICCIVVVLHARKRYIPLPSRVAILKQ